MEMLEMVQRVMNLVDNSTVSALDPAGANGVSRQAVAQRNIETFAFELFSTYIGMNTYWKVKLTPNASNFVFVPLSASNEPLVTQILPYGKDAHRNIVQLGNRLYDKDNNTYEFDGEVEVIYTTRFTVECLPIHLKWWCIGEAAMMMLDQRRDAQRWPRVIEKHRRWRANAQQIESDIKKSNMLGSATALQVLGERRNYNYTVREIGE